MNYVRKILSKIEFELLVAEYSQQVLTTAMRVVGNASLANDVHQEVFLAIWRRWHKYDGKTNWRPYLYRVTVRKAIELAKGCRQSEHLTEYPDVSEYPDGPIRTAELQARLAECLGNLPHRQAEVFVLTTEPSLRSGSRRSNRARLVSRSSITASQIQS